MNLFSCSCMCLKNQNQPLLLVFQTLGKLSLSLVVKRILSNHRVQVQCLSLKMIFIYFAFFCYRHILYLIHHHWLVAKQWRTQWKSKAWDKLMWVYMCWYSSSKLARCSTISCLVEFYLHTHANAEIWRSPTKWQCFLVFRSFVGRFRNITRQLNSWGD